MTPPTRPDRHSGDAVVLEGVTVRYRVAFEPRLSLKESFVRRKRRRAGEHVALDDISLTIARGETFGIIGSNGAGKTTMLSVLGRVLHPSAGRLRIYGSVVPLIDLVAGFHFELTGRENAFLRGAFLGVPRRVMRERVDEIEAFADLGPFFDAPLRTYSAGMILRLAFAAVTSIDADIFLVDEALGVGDADFQVKCALRIEELRARGRTFVIVSHDLTRLMAMSNRILWLDRGRARALGPPDSVVGQYAAAHS